MKPGGVSAELHPSGVENRLPGVGTGEVEGDLDAAEELAGGDAAGAAHAAGVDGDAEEEVAGGGEAAEGGGVEVEAAGGGGGGVGGRVAGGGGEREESRLGGEVLEAELAEAGCGRRVDAAWTGRSSRLRELEGE